MEREGGGERDREKRCYCVAYHCYIATHDIEFCTVSVCTLFQRCAPGVCRRHADERHVRLCRVRHGGGVE